VTTTPEFYAKGVVFRQVCWNGNSILNRSSYSQAKFWGIGALRSLCVTRSGPNAKLLRN